MRLGLKKAVGGESAKIKVRKVNVWPYVQQPFTWAAELLLLCSGMTTPMCLRGQHEHIPTWVLYWGKVEPLWTIFEHQNKFGHFYEDLSLQRIWL